MEPHLVIRNLSKAFSGATGSLQILNNVTLEIAKGSTIAITGPSGSGKSTLLNLIGSLDRPTRGQILLEKTAVHTLAGDALQHYRSHRVGFVFQDHLLLPQLNAIENVLLPTLALEGKDDHNPRASALLERVGLTERRAHTPARLSGGERQRVAIARALINGATLLLCDEPTGNLDRDTATSIVSLFLELAANDGITVIMVTHNLELANHFQRRLELRDGRLAESAD